MQQHDESPPQAFPATEPVEHWSTLLEAALDCTEDGVLVVGSGGRVLVHNQRFRDIWSLTAQDLEPGRHAVLLARMQRQVADGEAYLERVLELDANPERMSIDVLRLGDGRIIERFTRPYRINDEVAGRVWSFRDATRYRQMVAALRESEHRYRLLFEASQTPIYITTTDGRFMDVNDAMVELFGYTREELLALGAGELYADAAGRQRFREAMTETGILRDYEVRLRRRDGTVLDCLLSAAVHRDPAGTPIGYQGIIHDISEFKRREASLLHDAQHDPLTDLPDRRLFAARLDRAIERRRHGDDYRFSLLFVDLDDFKRINDTHGHLVGDQVLIAVARRLETLVRPEDTVARIGGDEFAILLFHVQDAEEAAVIAERVRDGLAMPHTLDQLALSCTASVGVALWTRHHTSANAFLAEADAAMYRAKMGGANRVEFYTN